MSLNPLLPVPVVEQRPLPESYPLRVVHGRIEQGGLERVTDEHGIRQIHPDLLSFGSQRGYGYRKAYFHDYSFMFGFPWGSGEEGPSAVKNNIKLSGTYDEEGGMTPHLVDKGIYIDSFF